MQQIIADDGASGRALARANQYRLQASLMREAAAGANLRQRRKLLAEAAMRYEQLAASEDRVAAGRRGREATEPSC